MCLIVQKNNAVHKLFQTISVHMMKAIGVLNTVDPHFHYMDKTALIHFSKYLLLWYKKKCLRVWDECEYNIFPFWVNYPSRLVWRNECSWLSKAVNGYVQNKNKVGNNNRMVWKEMPSSNPLGIHCRDWSTVSKIIWRKHLILNVIFFRNSDIYVHHSKICVSSYPFTLNRRRWPSL